MKKLLSEMSLSELWELFPIILKEHDPAYKEWYSVEEAAIVNSLGTNNIKRINHIGSSYVKGLIAKPIIDILLEIDENCDADQIKHRLVSAGWLLMSYEKRPDLKMVFNKGYTENGFAEKVFHLHVRYSGDWSELYFRDYLVNHHDIAMDYGRLKLELKEKYEHDRDGYTDAKSEFVNKYTKAARAEFKSRYTPEQTRNKPGINL